VKGNRTAFTAAVYLKTREGSAKRESTKKGLHPGEHQQKAQLGGGNARERGAGGKPLLKENV